MQARPLHDACATEQVVNDICSVRGAIEQAQQAIAFAVAHEGFVLDDGNDVLSDAAEARPDGRSATLITAAWTSAEGIPAGRHGPAAATLLPTGA
jgi:hypothetical protein